MNLEEAYERLASASEGEFDVHLLDEVIQAAYNPTNPQVCSLKCVE